MKNPKSILPATKQESETKPLKILVVGLPKKKNNFVLPYLAGHKVVKVENVDQMWQKVNVSSFDSIILYAEDIKDKIISSVQEMQSRRNAHTIALQENGTRRTGWKAEGLKFTTLRTIGDHLSVWVRGHQTA